MVEVLGVDVTQTLEQDVRALDRDGSGLISFDEFYANVLTKEQTEGATRLRGLLTKGSRYTVGSAQSTYEPAFGYLSRSAGVCTPLPAPEGAGRVVAHDPRRGSAPQACRPCAAATVPARSGSP